MTCAEPCITFSRFFFIDEQKCYEHIGTPNVNI